MEKRDIEQGNRADIRKGSARLLILAAVARLLGIQFHVDGMPYGAPKLVERGSSGSTAP